MNETKNKFIILSLVEGGTSSRFLQQPSSMKSMTMTSQLAVPSQHVL